MNENNCTLISLQVDRAFLAKAKKRAKDLGLTLSAYIRLCVLNELKLNDNNRSNLIGF